MAAATSALLALWLLSQIAVPIAGWIGGRRALLRVLSVAVVTQATVVTTLLALAWGGVRALGVALTILLFGWGVEYIGSRSGMPFGRYRYTDALRPQLGGVPLVVPLAWLMMLPPAWAAAAGLTEALFGSARFDGWGGWRLIFFIFASGGAIAAWDLFLDPMMIRWQCWRWERRGLYLGIPSSNMAGWVLTGALMTTIAIVIVGSAAPLPEALSLIYIATCLMQTIGQALFWRLPTSALVGFCIMGSFASAALLSLI